MSNRTWMAVLAALLVSLTVTSLPPFQAVVTVSSLATSVPSAKAFSAMVRVAALLLRVYVPSSAAVRVAVSPPYVSVTAVTAPSAYVNVSLWLWVSPGVVTSALVWPL